MLRAHRAAEARHADVCAQVGIALVDALRADLTPAHVQHVQDTLRRGLQIAAARRAALGARQEPRRERLKRRWSGHPDFGRCMGEVNAAAVEREGFVDLQRDILRQVGDACAWLVLGSDPHLLRNLADPKTAYALPKDVGLAGQVHIADALNAAGGLIALENDLTRCLGVGDVTVVRARGRTPRPLVLELKTRGRLAEGARLDIDVITAVSEHPTDAALFDDVIRVLDLTPGAADRPDARRRDSRSERQTAALQARAERIFRTSGRKRRVLGGGGAPGTWPVVERVVERALRSGEAFEVAERGVVMFALRRGTGDEETRWAALFSRADAAGLVPTGARLVGTAELSREPSYAWVVPPVALWKLGVEHRAVLLCGDVEFQCTFGEGIWVRAFTRHGVRLTANGGAWRLTTDGRTDGEAVNFDRVEVAKLLYGVALGGVNPNAVASAVAGELTRTTEAST